ncbi:MAG TPA: ribosome small subunit-dependent GTPase A [Actinocatenispora sp.]
MSINLGALGWDAAWADSFAPYGRSGCRAGRVSRVDRGVYSVLATDGAVRATAAGRLLAEAAKDLLTLPVAGDWVALRDWPDRRTTVEAVLARRTAVVRLGAGRDSLGQVLAANIDTAAVVEPLDPSPDEGRIERLLALAHQSGATPILVLTKADRVPDPAGLAEQLARAAPGVAVFPVCASDPASLAPLTEHLSYGRTLGLFGASGVGKSTLVNTLIGTSVLVTRALRADGKGRHTTTYRALVPVPDGGAVLDTPGIRSVGLDETADGLDRTFADVAGLAAECRFADCRHETEPGCAVLAAVADGTLSPRRLASWRKLRAELRWQADRRGARLAAADRAETRRLRAAARRRTDGPGSLPGS